MKRTSKCYDISGNICIPICKVLPDLIEKSNLLHSRASIAGWKLRQKEKGNEQRIKEENVCLKRKDTERNFAR